jgi:hypothetical protein
MWSLQKASVLAKAVVFAPRERGDRPQVRVGTGRLADRNTRPPKSGRRASKRGVVRAVALCPTRVSRSGLASAERTGTNRRGLDEITLQ